MGRAGRSGGGGGSHSSGGSHSFSSSRSGSSHSFRSSGRASRSSGSSRSSYTGRSSYTVRYVHHYSPGYYSPSYGYRSRGASIVVVIFFIVLILTFLYIGISSVNSGVTVNTTNREKLELGYGFTNNTLTDELGWIQDPGRLNRSFKEFYEDTGAVPYLALVSKPEVTAQGSDAEHAYANEWYSENLPHEGFILLMYFDTGNPSVDGNCQLICGKEAAFLMDSEAQQIFWDCLDMYWFSDADEDTVFAKAFTDTAGRIMQRTKTGKDVIISFMPIILVVVLAAIAIYAVKLRRRHEAARAEETATILNAPLRRSSSRSTEDEELLNKYNNSVDE